VYRGFKHRITPKGVDFGMLYAFEVLYSIQKDFAQKKFQNAHLRVYSRQKNADTTDALFPKLQPLCSITGTPW